MQGKLILFEGIDGAGKGTQIMRVAHWLDEQGLPFLLAQEPGGSKLGHHIRRKLLENDAIPKGGLAELFLFLADRAQHIQSEVKPALEQGKAVLCDRGMFSTFAYQGAKGIDLDFMANANRMAMQELHPDLTIWLDVSVEVACDRIAQRDGISPTPEQASFLESVRKQYGQLHCSYPNFIRINAEGTEAAIAEAIQQELVAHLNRAKRFVLDRADEGHWMIYDSSEGKRYPAGGDKQAAQQLIEKLNANQDRHPILWVARSSHSFGEARLQLSWGDTASICAIANAYNH